MIKSFIILIIFRSNNLYFMLRLYHNICCWSSKFYYIFRCSLMLLGLACIKEAICRKWLTIYDKKSKKCHGHGLQMIKPLTLVSLFISPNTADDGYRFLYSQLLMVVENIYKSILLKKIKFLIRLNFV